MKAEGEKRKAPILSSIYCRLRTCQSGAIESGKHELYRVIPHTKIKEEFLSTDLKPVSD
ncbi:MAG: hypothetical protein J7647_04370 [Cyanobacteria bacterium SBLK]|nr:hypothetical protein [Cyanobacteria bacterium SBLK]